MSRIGPIVIEVQPPSVQDRLAEVAPYPLPPRRHIMNAPAVGTVICATLRVSDLLPAFAAELEHLDPVTAAEVIGPYERWGLEYTREWIDANWEEALEMLTAVADQLERIGAENGYTFGAHESDGSDFGFWKGGA